VEFLPDSGHAVPSESRETMNRRPRRMLQRNLLYTGVTRSRRLVVLVGQKQAIAIAVRNASGRRRWSKLAERLAPKTPVSVDRKRV
jgi:ATP-dependent exoDNAse (exonuclease V) alpha subunit